MIEKNNFINAYETLVTPSIPYQESLELISSLVGTSSPVLDLGCGTGELLKKLHLINPHLESVGVDLSKEMLHFAKQKLNGYSSKLICSDMNSANLMGGFSAITSFNVLLNLESPMSHIDLAYRSLIPGGLFILSSPKEVPDFEKSKNFLLSSISNHPKKEELEVLVNDLFQKHDGFANDFRNTYSNDDIERILTDYMGFDEVLLNDSTYANNFILALRKRSVKERLEFNVSSNVNDYRSGFKLRYHVLHDWHRAISKSSDQMYFKSSDLNGFAGIINSKETGKLVGFVNAIPSGEQSCDIIDKESYSWINANFPNHVYLNSFAVVPYLQRKGLGVLLAGKLFDECLKRGFSAVVGEGNDGSAKIMERFGGEIIGENVLDSSKGVYSKMFYADLTNSAVKSKIKEYSTRLDFLLG